MRRKRKANETGIHVGYVEEELRRTIEEPNAFVNHREKVFAIAEMVRSARTEFEEEIRPRDDFEQAVADALGEISWDEAETAIAKHRASIADDVGILAVNGNGDV